MTRTERDTAVELCVRIQAAWRRIAQLTRDSEYLHDWATAQIDDAAAWETSATKIGRLRETERVAA